MIIGPHSADLSGGCFDIRKNDKHIQMSNDAAYTRYHCVEYRMWGATIACDSPCRVRPRPRGECEYARSGSTCYRITNVSLVEESSGAPQPSSVCRVTNQGLFELSVTPVTYGPRPPADPAIMRSRYHVDHLKTFEAFEATRELSALEEDRLVICTLAPGESRMLNITFNYVVR